MKGSIKIPFLTLINSLISISPPKAYLRIVHILPDRAFRFLLQRIFRFACIGNCLRKFFAFTQD